MQPTRLIAGGRHTDERGTVTFCNDFDFQRVSRFYMIEPAQIHETRGWVGHRREWKWFLVTSGHMVLGVVAPDDWKDPSTKLVVERFEMRADNPVIVEVPPGHATASVALARNSMLMVFSSEGLEAALGDDYRFPADTWDLRAEDLRVGTVDMVFP